MTLIPEACDSEVGGGGGGASIEGYDDFPALDLYPHVGCQLVHEEQQPKYIYL